MSRNKTIPGDRERGSVLVAQRRAAGDDNARIYAALRRSGLKISARDMVSMAGFGRSVSTLVDRRPAVVAALGSIDDQRERLQSAPGTTISDSVRFLKGVRDDKEVNDDTRIRADERIAKLLGYDAAPKADMSAGAQIIGAIAMLAQIAQACANGSLSAIVQDAEIVPTIDIKEIQSDGA